MAVHHLYSRTIKTICVAGILVFTPPGFAQSQSSCPSNDLVGLSQLAVQSGELLRAAELAKLQDPAKYCEDARRARYFNVKKKEFAGRGVNDPSDPKYEAAELDINADASIHSGNTWDLSFMSTQRLRRASFDRIRRTDGVWRPKDETFDELIEFFRVPSARTADELKGIEVMYDTIDKNRAAVKADIHLKASVLQWGNHIPTAIDGVMYTACAQLTLRAVECRRKIMFSTTSSAPLKKLVTSRRPKRKRPP